MQKKTESVDALQATVSKVTKALIFCEIDRFNKERLQTTSYLLGSLAVTNMQVRLFDNFRIICYCSQRILCRFHKYLPASGVK